MKQMHFFSAALVFVAALTFTSCKTSRVWAIKDKDRPVKEKKYEERNDDDDRYEPAPPPPPRYYAATTPLILTPSAGFVMNRYPDGRFYHRSAQGLLYWKGYNNRFYLDHSYVNRVKYDRFEYDQWKQYYPSPSYGQRY